VKSAGAWVAAIALFIIYAGEPVDAADSAGVSVSAGLGYDFISQEYFLQSIADTSLDTLDVAFDLTTNYVDNVKGQLGFTVRPWSKTDFEWRNLFEQTSESFRIKSTPELYTHLGGSRLELSGELDFRDQRDDGDTASYDAGYVYLYGRGRLITPLSEQYNGYLRVTASSVNFSEITSFNYGHQRAGLEIGLERLFANFSSARLDLFVQARRVPDSTEINYLSLGANGSALWLYSGGSLDFWGRFERKDYNRPNGLSDFNRTELDFRNQFRLGPVWKFRQEADIEFTVFTGADDISFDYSRWELLVLIGRDIGEATILLGPRVEILNEMPADDDLEEDYTELGGQLNVDYFNLSRLFLSAQSELGRRSWGNEISLNSDFVFHRLYLLFDLTIVESLSLNSLFSAEWEWHDDEQDNSRLYLLSSMLTLEF